MISLKERVANEMQIPVCQQKLVFKGKTLAGTMSADFHNKILDLFFTFQMINV